MALQDMPHIGDVAREMMTETNCPKTPIDPKQAHACSRPKKRFCSQEGIPGRVGARLRP